MQYNLIMNYLTTKPVGLYVLVFSTAIVLHILWPWPFFPELQPVWITLAVILLAVVGAVNTWITRLYRQHRTPYDPDEAPVALITKGPYRYSRNPIYVLLVLSMVSLGLLLMSTWLLGGSAVLAMALHYVVIIKEEDELRTHFPHDYETYAQKTPRWLVIND